MTHATGIIHKEVYSLLRQDQPHRKSVAIPLLTVDNSGNVRVCLLSPYQVFMSSSSPSKDGKPGMFFAVYHGSSTNKNLLRRHKATLLVPTPPSVNYIRGVTKYICDFHLGNPNFQSTLYAMYPTDVMRDYYPNAPIKLGLTFDATNIKKQYSLYYDKIIDLARAKRG